MGQKATDTVSGGGSSGGGSVVDSVKDTLGMGST